MSCTRKQFVTQMQSWIGLKESDGSHRQIIDIYNTIRPLPRGYKLTYWDAWCAGGVSAAAKACNATDIIPAECGCPSMIALAQKMGIWVEADDYVPTFGDIVMYDWQDKGTGDNRGGADHVGVVEKVSGNDMVIIECNYDGPDADRVDGVERRNLEVNGRYIRGYIVPNFDPDDTDIIEPSEPVVDTEPVIEPVEETYKPTVKDWQEAAIADGFKFPKYGADGEWGNECISVAKKATLKLWTRYTNLTILVQRVVGADPDGAYGYKTRTAVINYQKAHNLTPDGKAGINTYKTILGI